MATGITKNITGVLTLTDKYELTQYDDILNITNATLTLSAPAGELSTGAGNDVATVINSTITATASGLSFSLGNGDDTLSLASSIIDVPVVMGSGADTVLITGDPQSSVVLKKRTGVATLSFGDGDDILEIAAILSGGGDIDFGTGNDTLRLNGGALLTTGAITNLNHLEVLAAGGNLGRSLTLTGDAISITLGGNLIGNSAGNRIVTADSTVTLTTADSIQTNVAFTISNVIFTHQSGGTLEISGNSGDVFIAVNSTVTLHDLTASFNGGGISGSNTVWTIKDSSFSDSMNSAASLIGGSLDLTNVDISNHAVNSLRLDGTILTGSGVSFSGNRTSLGQVFPGGAIYSNADITLAQARFHGNHALTSTSAQSGIATYASSKASASAFASAFASGGAIYQAGGNMDLTSATFSGNYATATAYAGSFARITGGSTVTGTATASATANATASANGGAIYRTNGSLALTSATFSGNNAFASASAFAETNITLYNYSLSMVAASATASANGGAIYQTGGSQTLTSATFSGNKAVAFASASASAFAGASGYAKTSAYAFSYGGAIYQLGGNLTLTSANFTDNSAAASAISSASASSSASALASVFAYSYGGAIYASSAIVNTQDAVFTNNSATAVTIARGGAIYLAGTSVMTYAVTTGGALSNTGNTATNGGFLYMESTASSVFDIASGASLTIGNTSNASSVDSIAGSGSITKSGAGTMTIHSDISEYTGTWTVSGGVLQLATLARTITLDNWTIGSDGTLQLSDKNDTVNMRADKAISILDLGGGSDVINTGGYTLSSGELRIGTLTLTGGGRITSAITIREAGVGFDLTLDNIGLESTITGGSVGDTIRIAKETQLKGAIDLGDGDNVITASAKATFAKTLAMGSGNDTLSFAAVTFEDSVNLGAGNNSLTAGGAAFFSGKLVGGAGNDTITLSSDATFSGLIDLGGGENVVGIFGNGVVSEGVKMTAGGEIRLMINKGATLAGNTLSVFANEDAVMNTVTRNWSSIAGLDTVRLVVSSDSTFRTFEFAVELYNQSKSFTLNVEEGYSLQLQKWVGNGWEPVNTKLVPNTNLLSNGHSQTVAWDSAAGKVGYVAIDGESAPPWVGVWEWSESEAAMWKVVAVGRFSADVEHDGILLYNGNNNTFAAWTDLNDPSYGYISLCYVGGNFQTLTLADFDNNGLDDVIIYDENGSFGIVSDARTYHDVWHVDNPETNVQKVIGAGYFGNADGKSDILVYKTDENAYFLWHNQDSTFNTWNWSQTYIGSLDDDWTVAAIGDFQGDGIDDIIMWQKSTGNMYAWEDGKASNQRWVGQLDASQWEVAAVGDYNGDGKEDLLLRELSSGWGGLGYWGAANADNWTDLNARVETDMESKFAIIA